MHAMRSPVPITLVGSPSRRLHASACCRPIPNVTNHLAVVVDSAKNVDVAYGDTQVLWDIGKPSICADDAMPSNH
eukprot:2010081-Amphidinium_carterae.2